MINSGLTNLLSRVNGVGIILMRTIACIFFLSFAFACGKPKTAAVVLVQPEAQIFEGSRPSDRTTTSTGVLRVEVMDEKGKPLSGAIVRLKWPSGDGLIYKAVESDKNGKGSILLVTPGEYQLVVLMDGFSTVSLKRIKILANNVTFQQIRMQVYEGDSICLDGCGDPCWGLNTIDTTSSTVMTHIPIECYRKFAN